MSVESVFRFRVVATEHGGLVYMPPVFRDRASELADALDTTGIVLSNYWTEDSDGVYVFFTVEMDTVEPEVVEVRVRQVLREVLGGG